MVLIGLNDWLHVFILNNHHFLSIVSLRREAVWMFDVTREVIMLCAVKIELTPYFIRAEWSCRADSSGSLELLHQALFTY